MDCILLAGGRPAPGDTLYELTQGEPKALLSVAGRPMIEWVLGALRSSRSVERIVVVGLDTSGGRGELPEVDAVEQLRRDWGGEGVVFLRGQGGFAANLYAGIEALPGPGPVLYSGSDIPLVDGTIIDRFVDAAGGGGADIAAGLVSRTSLQARYPAAEDLWLSLREGQFIAADLAVFDPAAAPGVRRHLEALAPHRKSAVRQARYVGFGLLLRYVARRLTIPAFEAHLLRRFGIRCRVLQAPDPEVGLDVDGLAAFEICSTALERR